MCNNRTNFAPLPARLLVIFLTQGKKREAFWYNGKLHHVENIG